MTFNQPQYASQYPQQPVVYAVYQLPPQTSDPDSPYRQGNPQQTYNPNQYGQQYPPQYVGYQPRYATRDPEGEGSSGTTMTIEEGPKAKAKAKANNRKDSRKFHAETCALFSDQTIRRAFIRKVYSILTVQLVVTTAIIALFVFVKGVPEALKDHYSWLQPLAYVSFAVSFFIVVCCRDCSRKSPQNYIVLAVLTLSLAFMTAVISSQYSTDVVAIAFGCTAAIVFALTVFAFQTKWDFTGCGPFLCGILCVFMLAGFMLPLAFYVFGYSKIVHMVFAFLGAAIFSMYLVYDTQMLLGGRSVEINEEDYVFAATQLYVDIVYIFIYLLQAIGLADS